MTSRTAHRISFGLGLIVLALALYSAMQPPMVPCGGLAKNYPTIIAFELARTPADLAEIFGQGASACRAAITPKIDFINWVDVLVFIPVYTGFLVFFFLGMRKQSAVVANLGAVLMIVAALADFSENAALFHLSGDPEGATAWLPWLEVSTWTKWILLGVGGGLAANLLSKLGGYNWLLAGLCLISLAAPLLAVSDPHSFGPYLSNGITVSWLVFLLVDIRESLRARQ